MGSTRIWLGAAGRAAPSPVFTLICLPRSLICGFPRWKLVHDNLHRVFLPSQYTETLSLPQNGEDEQ